jgi:hypothetical protein
MKRMTNKKFEECSDIFVLASVLQDKRDDLKPGSHMCVRLTMLESKLIEHWAELSEILQPKPSVWARLINMFRA